MMDGMGKGLNDMIWGDNWHIEEERAWFVDGQRDRLCYVDLKLNKYEYITDIPNTELNKHRLNSMCLKIENEIYLMPIYGRKIWIYNLDNSQFEQIVINNPDNVCLKIYNFWIYGDKIYALSIGLQKIIEVDIRRKVISNYFMLHGLDELDIENETGIRVGEDIYYASSETNCIYQFNLESKQITTYVVPMVEGGFYTISYDGRLFWLSGCCKEIYIWDKENNSTKVSNDFPQNFGIYDFRGNSEDILDCTAVIYDDNTFVRSMQVGNYIWFIPWRTNKVIYVDTETYQISAFEIAGEEENRESLLKHCISQKYIVQYIREDRYIGLFSLKNNYIIEIDAVEKRVEKKPYSLGERSIKNYIRSMNGTLYEGKEFDKMILSDWLMQDDTSETVETDNVGYSGVGIRIYREIQSS